MDFSIIHELLTPPFSGAAFKHIQAGLLASGLKRPRLPSRQSCQKWTTDGGYEVDSRLQWRDRPGLSPGSLFSLSGTWNMCNVLVRSPFYSLSLALSKKILDSMFEFFYTV